jgi:hypothetical protein
MTRRVAICVFSVVLAGVIGCGAKTLKPPTAGCAGYETAVVMEDGHRYLRIRLPDGHSVIVNLDTLPQPTAGPVPLAMCPCEQDECSRMCRAIAPETTEFGKGCLVPPVDAGAPSVPLDAAHP